MICERCKQDYSTTRTIITHSNTTTVTTCSNCNNVEVKSTSPKVSTDLLNIY